ncbi:hypothetical protein Hanom_Chr01g00085701 [Helianthus anomalus]
MATGKSKEVVISLLPLVKVPTLFNLYLRCPSYNSFRAVKSFLKGSSTELFYIVVCFNDETMIGDVYLFKLDMTSVIWEEMVDLKDAIIFMELANRGYIHILGNMGKVVYSFYVKDRTLSLSYMPCLVQQCHVSAWAMLEYRLEVEHPESKQDDKENEILVRPVKGGGVEFGSITSESHDSHLFNIPLHILKTIMELCVGVEYMKFRATCKHCYLAAPLSQWSSKTSKRLQLYSLVKSPWLMVLDTYRNIITFIDPIYGEKYFIKTPQELKDDYQKYCSMYGLLLLYKFRGPLVFFNPLTSDIRKLPEVPYMQSFCFSAPPTSLNYIYALCNNKRIEAFRDIADDDFTWDEVTNNVPIRSSADYFLSSCDQHLLLVIVGVFGDSLEVLKLNNSTDGWEKIDGLGKHMIYISNTSCICLEAKSP